MKSLLPPILFSIVTVSTVSPCWSEDASPVLLNGPHAKVTKLDFDASLQQIPEADRPEFLMEQNRINANLQALYVNRALANEARKLKMDSEPVIAAELQIHEDQLLAKLRMEKLKREVALPDFNARAREIYIADGDQFKVAPQVHVWHILVDMKSRSREDALKRATEILAKIKAKPEDFGTLAEELSDDPSAKVNKGDLGTFSPGRMVKPFSDAAFALREPGQISEPIETTFGFHILKLIDRKEGYKKPFDMVKQDIIKRLKQEYLDAVVADYLNAIKGDRELKADTEAIAKLKPKIIGPAPTPKKSEKNN